MAHVEVVHRDTPVGVCLGVRTVGRATRSRSASRARSVRTALSTLGTWAMVHLTGGPIQ
jgi:hypothetical protein